MEKRDLYNEKRELLNKTILKDQEIPENCYILVVVIFIQNEKGEFLIQKRSLLKGGLWAFTGGHPKAGENSLEGIKTEVKEEIGIEIDNPILFKSAIGKNTIGDLYYLKKDVDINDIVMQEEEVSEVAYATKDEIIELYNKGLFKKSHYMMFNDLLEYFKSINKEI